MHSLITNNKCLFQMFQMFRDKYNHSEYLNGEQKKEDSSSPLCSHWHPLVITPLSQLAQAAVMAATRASGSGGGPWADPPVILPGGTLSHFGPGLPSGPSCAA